MTKPLTRLEKIDQIMLQHPVVDATITFLDHTLVRPLPILWAGLVGLGGFGFTYYVARDVGFSLNGGELWLFLTIGWCIGLASELLLALRARYSK